MFLVEMFRNVYQSLFNALWGKRELRIVMFGLDAVGKTTILYQLKLGQVVTTIPTIGFNVEAVQYKNISFVVWDLAGGKDKLRPLWHHYMQDTSAIIYVIDTNDRQRLEEAKMEMMMLLEEERFPDVPFLILANKIDLPDTLSVKEITELLDLSSLQLPWHIQATSAITGQGLYEGLDWLIIQLTDKT